MVCQTSRSPRRLESLEISHRGITKSTSFEDMLNPKSCTWGLQSVLGQCLDIPSMPLAMKQHHPDWGSSGAWPGAGERYDLEPLWHSCTKRFRAEWGNFLEETSAQWSWLHWNPMVWMKWHVLDMCWLRLMDLADWDWWLQNFRVCSIGNGQIKFVCFSSTSSRLREGLRWPWDTDARFGLPAQEW